MRRSRSRLTALVAALAAGALTLTACATPFATRPPISLEASQARELARALKAQLDASDAVLTKLVRADDPGCSAAVAREGVVVWAGARGMADLGKKIPVTIDTRFDIASVSKQFTATAILMLQRDRELKLSDTVGTYVSGLPGWGKTVTLDQLIHHTSRIPDYWVELAEVGIGFEHAADMTTTLEAIRRETALEPGSGFLYSNSNYVLLAEVVRKVSGQKLPEFLDERIFAPLGLAMAVAPTAKAPDIARSYDDQNKLQETGWNHYGHSGIITTASELARWGDQYREGDIIQDDFAVGAVDEAEGELYAAGMDIEVDGDLNHTGRMGGYISDFTVSADRVWTVAVMCNGHAANRFPIAKALWLIWHPRDEAAEAAD